MSENRLERLALKLTQISLVLTLALATASLGTPKGGGAGPQAGFSSGSWSGTPHFNKSHYEFGIIGAGEDTASELCSGPSSDYLEDGVEALVDSNAKAHVFWFLISHYTAAELCGYGGTPAQWGQLQAQRFIDAVDAHGLSSSILYMIGDVEYAEDVAGCAADPTGCCFVAEISDAAGWLCDSQSDNRTVIREFQETLDEEYDSILHGVYTNPGHWPDITGGATAAQTGAVEVGMANYDPSQGILNTNAEYFRNKGFFIWGWQYTDSCDMSYSEAEDLLHAASVDISRWDMWTNSSPNTVCGVK